MAAPAASDLASSPLFRALSAEELTDVAAWFEVKEVGAGVRLVGEGRTGLSFFVLVEGEVAVTVDRGELATLGPGDFFGEMALLRHGRRAASVTTVSPARVLVMFGDDFRRLVETYPAVGGEIEASMAERLRAL